MQYTEGKLQGKGERIRAMEKSTKSICEGAGGAWSTMNIIGTLTGCHGTVTMEKAKTTLMSRHRAFTCAGLLYSLIHWIMYKMYSQGF